MKNKWKGKQKKISSRLKAVVWIQVEAPQGGKNIQVLAGLLFWGHLSHYSAKQSNRFSNQYARMMYPLVIDTFLQIILPFLKAFVLLLYLVLPSEFMYKCRKKVGLINW